MKFDTDFIGSVFSSVASSFYNAGYDLDVDTNLHVTVIPHSDVEYPAEITVTTYREGEGEDELYYFIPDMKFPEIKGSDLDFYDSLIYHTKQFVRIAEACTDLIKFEFQPAMYEY